MDILALAMPRVAFLALLSMLVLLARGYAHRRTLAACAAVLLLLAARELLLAANAPAGLAALADFCMLSAYLILAERRIGSRAARFAYFVPHALAYSFFLFWARFVAFANPLPGRLVNAVHAPVLADAILLMLFAWRTRNEKSEPRRVQASVTCILASSFALRAALLYATGTAHRLVIGGALLPLDAAHAFYLFALMKSKTREERSELSVLTRYQSSFLDFMFRVWSEFSGDLNTKKMHDYILESAMGGVNADGGAVFLVDDQEDVLTVQAVEGTFPPPCDVPSHAKASSSSLRSFLKSTPVPMEGNPLGDAVKSGFPLVLRGGKGSGPWGSVFPGGLGRCRSFIAAPLVVANRSLGLLAVSRDSREFTDDDCAYLKFYTRFAALSIENGENLHELVERREIEKETLIAAEIQQKLIQKNLPRMNGLGLAAYSTPARGVSSDYYDVLSLDRNRIGVAICDVAGKGIPATLVMVMIRSLLHLLASPGRRASEVTAWINRGITGTVDIDHFATFSYLVYDHESREVTYSNAAHLPLVVCRNGGGGCELVDTEGLPLGIDKATRYTQKTLKLGKGEEILLFTDGIVESMNERGEQYGMGALLECVRRHAPLPPEEQVRKIGQELEKHEGGNRQRDDRTVIVLKVQ
jgi:sigma-B regulation protein RsbU (phosphoserine phosphatase)